jgi:hypothetical protein
MPTGYTAALADRKFNVRDWLLNDLIRGMGVCVMLRDEGTLTAEEIREKLVKEVDQAKARMFTCENASDSNLPSSREEWKVRYNDETNRTNTYNAKQALDYAQGKGMHQKVLDQLNEASKNAKTIVGVGIMDFAIEQIKSAMEFDYGSGPYKSEIAATLDEYIEEEIDKVETGRLYHLKAAKEALKRAEDTLKEYDAFVAEVDRLFPATPTEVTA